MVHVLWNRGKDGHSKVYNMIIEKITAGFG